MRSAVVWTNRRARVETSLFVPPDCFPDGEANLNAAFEPVAFLPDGTITIRIPEDQDVQPLEVLE